MSELLWAKEQMSLRKLANQFLAKIRESGCKRVLITSVQRGDGKSRFITELAAEMGRVHQEIIPLAASNLSIIPSERLGDKLVVVYGPAYLEEEGLHTIPEGWMRAFDAAVVLVMLRRTRTEDLKQLIGWLKEYQLKYIWPVVNEQKMIDWSNFWARVRNRLGLSKPPDERHRRRRPAEVWLPLLAPLTERGALRLLPAAVTENVARSEEEMVVELKIRKGDLDDSGIRVVKSTVRSDAERDEPSISNDQDAQAQAGKSQTVERSETDVHDEGRPHVHERGRFDDEVLNKVPSATETIRSWSSMATSRRSDDDGHPSISASVVTILSSSPPPRREPRGAGSSEKPVGKVTILSSVPPMEGKNKNKETPIKASRSLRATLISSAPPPARRQDETPLPTSPKSVKATLISSVPPPANLDDDKQRDPKSKSSPRGRSNGSDGSAS